MSDLHGIFAVDPGGMTGVAWGVFDLALGTVADVLREPLECGSLDVGGRNRSEKGHSSAAHADEVEQAITLTSLWYEFVKVCEGYNSPVCACPYDLVMEDWQPRLPLRSGERVVFFPVRIPALFVGMLIGGASGVDWPDVVWQQPGQVKAFATDARLRRWGRWVRGSDHQRDAWRHIASRLDALLG